MIGTSDKIQPHNTNLNLPREEKISGAYFIVAVGFICLVSSLQVMNKDELTIILIVGFLGLSVLWMILAKKIYFPLSFPFLHLSFSGTG